LINRPDVKDIVVKQIYNGRWISYGVLNKNRNIMTSITEETKEKSLEALINFAIRLSNDEN
jgi:hypothetical protein